MNLINKTKMDIFLEKKVFTLFDMIKLDLSHIAQLYEFVCRAVKESAEEYKPVDYLAFRKEQGWWFSDLGYECKELNLIFTRKQIKRLMSSVDDLDDLSVDKKLHEHYAQEYRSQITALKNILEDELKGQIAYRLSMEYNKFLDNCFNEQAVIQFPELEYDMREACNCIAFERFTAAVFHLMRIIEGAIKKFAKHEGIKELWYDSWERIIEELQKYIKSLPVDRRKKADELREITLLFRLVKDAWRNPTMHLEKKYTPEEVLGIFDATNQFVAKIAEKVK